MNNLKLKKKNKYNFNNIMPQLVIDTCALQFMNGIEWTKV